LLTAAAACAALLLRRLSAQVQFAAALVLTVLLSPLAEQYHYVLVLLPFALLCMHAYVTDSRRLGLALLIAALLLATPVDYKSYSPGWWALLDYPRLAAGWLIFLALLSVARLRTVGATDASDGEPDQRKAQRRD
jgi:general stress protein CsbA